MLDGLPRERRRGRRVDVRGAVADRRRKAVERTAERIEHAPEERITDRDARRAGREAHARARRDAGGSSERRSDEDVATEAEPLEAPSSPALHHLELAADGRVDALDLEELSDGVLHATERAKARREARSG